MSISRRTALATGAAAVVTGATTAPLAVKAALAATSDDPLVALGRQWQEAYDNWLQFSTAGDSFEEIVELENQREDLDDIAWQLENEAADVPARSLDGVLVKLRMAGTHYHLMERDGEGWADHYAELTWQAWDGLERLVREPVS